MRECRSILRMAAAHKGAGNHLRSKHLGTSSAQCMRHEMQRGGADKARDGRAARSRGGVAEHAPSQEPISCSFCRVSGRHHRRRNQAHPPGRTAAPAVLTTRARKRAAALKEEKGLRMTYPGSTSGA